MVTRPGHFIDTDLSPERVCRATFGRQDLSTVMSRGSVAAFDPRRYIADAGMSP